MAFEEPSGVSSPFATCKNPYRAKTGTGLCFKVPPDHVPAEVLKEAEMSELGQKRRFGSRPATSGLSQRADIF
jgi:hypothetical protein